MTAPATGGAHVRRAMTADSEVAFSHSANCYGVHPGNTPCKPPTHRRMCDPFKTASGVQSSGPWDPWLPAVEDRRLFARHTVRPQTAVRHFQCETRCLSFMQNTANTNPISMQ